MEKKNNIISIISQNNDFLKILDINFVSFEVIFCLNFLLKSYDIKALVRYFALVSNFIMHIVATNSLFLSRLTHLTGKMYQNVMAWQFA